MTVEKLTEYERRAACGTLLEKAVRIIDAHEAETAALRVELDEAEQRAEYWLKQEQKRDEKLKATKAELAEARDACTRYQGLEFDKGCKLTAALAELAEARADGERLRAAKLDREEKYVGLAAELAEARALLDQMRQHVLCPRTWRKHIDRVLAANPVSPFAERDEDQAQRVSDEMFAHDLAAAERAVLDAVRRWVDGEVTSVAHITAAEHALREVKS